MFDTDFLTLIAIASVCAGFLFGYILRGLFRRNEKPNAYYKLEKALEGETIKAEKTNPNWREMVHLWRDRRNGKLIFEVGNQFYKHGVDLPIKDRAILLEVSKDFSAWLQPVESISQKEVKPLQPVQPVIQQDQWIGKSSTVLVQGDRRHTKPVSVHPVNVLAQALRSDGKQSATPMQNMVTQVNAILQEKLDMAGMKKWAIRLTELPKKGMVVLVGLEQYHGIDEVPYKRVRRVIRESVSEWEHRVEVGSVLQ